MAVPREISTDRLRLRGWNDGDRASFAAMNADPRVMEHYPARWSREESDSAIDRMNAHIETHGFGFWAVETIQTNTFIGTVGISIPTFEAHFTPCVEIGWRLAYDHWHQGYATEAARATMSFGFDTLELPEIVALTIPANHRSRRVMEAIGMRRDPAEDFDHPKLPEGHPIRPHVLYRRKRFDAR